jgi:hypothetical protein
MIRVKYTLITLIALFTTACDLGYLELKPDQRISTPNNLDALEALMDNTNVLNVNSVLLLGEISADDYVISEADWNTLTQHYQKYGSIWKPDIYEDQQCPGWNNAYLKILYANTVLENIDNVSVPKDEISRFNRIKGTALFWRAWQYFQLSQIFADNYTSENAFEKLGLPLRTFTDINKKISRASLGDTYEHILKDLREARELLPTRSNAINRPSKIAASALLSRIYLQMNEYSNAIENATWCIENSNGLIDYNTVNNSAAFAFPLYGIDNKESFLFDVMLSSPLFITYLKVNPDLLSSYDENDLRRDVYFSSRNGYHNFKGSYNGYNSMNPFPALDEIYLIRSECNARLGRIEEALNDLNTLLVNRYKTNSYIAKNKSNSPEIFEIIFAERRKSLVYRGVRWSDIRRLESPNRITREIGNATYTLSTKDKKLLTWPIPNQAIILGGYIQNIR